MPSNLKGDGIVVFSLVTVIAFVAIFSAAILCLDDGNDDGDIVASDYSNADNWLKVPGTIGYEVDVFYLYPSGFAPSYEGEECTIDNSLMRENAVNYYKAQATAFEGLANIYAPFYRQVDASSLAGLSQPEMVEREMGAPRADVYASLDYHFENYNEG